MSLEDRFCVDSYIRIRALTSAIYLIMRGIITVNDVILKFSLDAQERTQLNQVINHYNLLSNQDKLLFYGDFESFNSLLAEGYITFDQYTNLLGITKRV